MSKKTESGEEPGDPKAGPEDRTAELSNLTTSAFEGTFQMEERTSQIGPGVDAEFPVQNWDRYELISLLGEGGMGRVFKAYDGRLNRYVALKFILREGPEGAKRFLREAQAQARVDHEHICRIYEVNQVQEKPYIAMQYIDGKTLSRLYKQLTLREKLEIMRDVSEGIHAAHRLKLIHRDIKPGNIMVETREGRRHPYIMDFGLARPVESAELTQAGFVIGTPAFMSPEQASGDRNLDRRSDVYSLGATLYAIVSGRPPYEGTSPMEVLSNIASTEPAPLRNLNVPRELETIILKCLEKDPAHRYDSARALADDLQRFLDGEPIQARPAGRLYRLGKKLRKSPVASGIAAVALLCIFVTAGLLLHARRTAQQRTQAAQQFGQQVARTDSIMRYAYMLPLHDVAREREMVRRQIQEIPAAMARFGAGARGPAEYAVGRGHLALHEDTEARKWLEQAESHGFRTPELSYALGLALAALFQKELETAERILDRGEREARIKSIENDFRAPALRHLEAARASRTESTDYISALIEFCRKDYAAALRHSDAAIAKIPWLYEAIRLQGDVYFRRAIAERDAGNFEKARENYRAADRAYRRAIAMAGSDSLTYDRAGALWLSAAAMELYYSGGDVESGVRNVLELADLSHRADPASTTPLIRRSQANTALAEHLANRGEDAGDAIRQAIASADSAIALAPKSHDGHKSRGVAFLQKAYIESLEGTDPRPALEQAAAAYRKSIELHPDDASWNDLGYSFLMAAEYESGRGLNPVPNLDRSIEAYRSALRINPESYVSRNNLGISYDNKGLYELQHGQDPTKSLRLALENYQGAIDRNPRWSLVLSNQGNSYIYLAEYDSRKGVDPTPNLQQAVECFQKAIAINATRPNFHSNLAGAWISMAAHLIRTGKDPTSLLAQAQSAVRKAQELNPGDYYFPWQLAQVEVLRARRARALGAPVSSFLAQARKLLDAAVKLNAEDADCWTTSAEARLLSLRPEEIEKGLQDARRALAIHPEHPRAMAVQGALLQRANRHGAVLLQRAMELDPSLKPDFLEFL